MIELVLTLIYVGLSGLILWRYRQSWRAEAKPGVVDVKCEENESAEVRGGRLRCIIRAKLARKRKPSE